MHVAAGSVLAELEKQLRIIYGDKLKKIVLYGSYARNDQDPDSDIDLIETRPRSVFNARPVKDNISAKLLEAGRRLSGPREMVKLLRLCVDYGQEKVMEAISHIGNHELSVEQVRAYLIPVANEPAKIHQVIDIPVAKPQFEKCDTLMCKEAAL